MNAKVTSGEGRSPSQSRPRLEREQVTLHTQLPLLAAQEDKLVTLVGIHPGLPARLDQVKIGASAQPRL